MDLGQSYSQSWGFQQRVEIANQNICTQQDTVDLTNDQYSAGLVVFRSVLDAEPDLYANEDQLVLSQPTVIANLIALYRALGRGWSAGGAL